MPDLFRRCERNPIITVEDIPFPAEAVLNPGATTFEDQVVLLLRVEHASGYSSIYVARSDNGVSDWDISREPLLQQVISRRGPTSLVPTSWEGCSYAHT